MLVLSRKVGEKIVIGDGVTLIVKRIVGSRVTFGIDAPPEIRIIRGELEAFAPNDRSGHSKPVDPPQTDRPGMLPGDVPRFTADQLVSRPR